MRGGKKGAHKGRERVLVENEDDIIARNMMEEEKEKKKKEEESESETTSSSEEGETAKEPNREEVLKHFPIGEEKEKKVPKAKPIIEVNNSNRSNKKSSAETGSLEVHLSSKQKKEMEQQKAKEAYFQKTLEGKTPEAKATLERLARIRAEREAAAKRRKEEEEAKKAMEAKVLEQARLKNESTKKKCNCLL